MSGSENAEIADLIDRAFTGTFGGRASNDDVFREVAADLPDYLIRHLAGPGLKTAIGRYFRAKRKDGLPHAPEVNAEGLHVQLDLLDVPEFEYVIGQQLKRSSEFYGQALKLADRCKTIHGVTIALELLDMAR